MKSIDHFISKALKICFVLFILDAKTFAQQNQKPVFKVIPLGIYGGSHESNLSSYMLSVKDSNNYICFDAGTLHDGIAKAVEEHSLTGDPATILKNNVKGYLISHPHLDHVAGLIINSPDDASKNIYATRFCLNIIQEKYFSWKSWANFGDEGEKPVLKKYHYVSLSDSETVLPNTNMFVKAFELSHVNPYKSTAFLVRHDSSFVLYLGDTGADTIERSTKLYELWSYIAPLINQQKLKGIFIEVSFPDAQPKDKLFGHLTPSLLIGEMGKLSSVASEHNLQKVPVIITHIKPVADNEATIKKELQQQNKLNLNIVFPQQGKLIEL